MLRDSSEVKPFLLDDPIIVNRASLQDSTDSITELETLERQPPKPAMPFLKRKTQASKVPDDNPDWTQVQPRVVTRFEAPIRSSVPTTIRESSLLASCYRHKLKQSEMLDRLNQPQQRRRQKADVKCSITLSRTGARASAPWGYPQGDSKLRSSLASLNGKNSFAPANEL